MLAEPFDLLQRFGSGCRLDRQSDIPIAMALLGLMERVQLRKPPLCVLSQRFEQAVTSYDDAIAIKSG